MSSTLFKMLPINDSFKRRVAREGQENPYQQHVMRMMMMIICINRCNILTLDRAVN